VEFKVGRSRVFAATGGKPFDPALPAVVLVHGAGNDHTVWHGPARYFAYHGRSVLAIDLPGHGRSGGKAPTTIEDMAKWLGRAVDTLGIQNLSIAGHSMGALIALEAAAMLGERVTALALLGVATAMPVHPELVAAARRDDHLAVELITSWGFSRYSQIGGCRGPGLWMSGGGTRLLERIPDGVLGNDLVACDTYTRAPESAGRVSCPTLLILGQRDLMTPPRGGAELAAGMADARTVTLADCGHMMLVEKPDETLDALSAIL
jgi:pimeloyl-ACP methyl ester carboxylesterase